MVNNLMLLGLRVPGVVSNGNTTALRGASLGAGALAPNVTPCRSGGDLIVQPSWEVILGLARPPLRPEAGRGPPGRVRRTCPEGVSASMAMLNGSGAGVVPIRVSLWSTPVGYDGYNASWQ